MNRFQEFTLLLNDIEDAYICAMTTDTFTLDVWPSFASELKDLEETALEIRVFNNDLEIKIFRSDISKEFRLRKIYPDDEKSGRYSEYIEENQYLDIDTVRSNSFKEDKRVFTTTGGSYKLPYETMVDAKMRVRYYLEKSENGKAIIYDWRLVDIVKETK